MILRRLVLVTTSTVGALLVAEGVARYGPEALAVPPGLAAAMDPPTASCAELSPTRGYWIAGRCYRDADGFLTPQGRGDPAALRILLVGDSVGAQDWTEWLAQALEDSMGRPVELLNAAVPGYGTCQEAAALREGLIAARPHAVVLQTCANDMATTPVVLAEGETWLRVRLGDGWYTVPRLLAGSVLVQRLVFVSAFAQVHLPEPVAAESSARGCAEEAVARAAEAGVPLLVLHFPVMAEPGEVLALPAGQGVAEQFVSEEIVQRYWADSGATAVDLRAPLGALGPWDTLRYAPTDILHPHPDRSPAIGRTVAPIVAEWLSARTSP